MLLCLPFLSYFALRKRKDNPVASLLALFGLFFIVSTESIIKYGSLLVMTIFSIDYRYCSSGNDRFTDASFVSLLRSLFALVGSLPLLITLKASLFWSLNSYVLLLSLVSPRCAGTPTWNEENVKTAKMKKKK